MPEPLMDPSWQTRRDAWSAIVETAGATIAKALAKEQNAKVLEAALEGLASWVKSSHDVAAAVEAGLIDTVVDRGLGAARPTTAKQGLNVVAEALGRGGSVQAAAVDATLRGLGADTRRAGGRVPASCARLLATHLPEGARVALGPPLAKLLDAASSDCRLAAAELVVAFETVDSVATATFIESLGASAQKAVERARGARPVAEPAPTESVEQAPPATHQAAPSAIGEETVVASADQPVDKWATADDFFDDLKERVLTACATDDNPRDPSDEDWLARLVSPAWITRKAALQTIADVFAEGVPETLKDAIGVCPMFEGMAAAVSGAASGEPHAKVAATAVLALAAVAATLGSACIPTVKRATFGEQSGDEAVVDKRTQGCLQRLRDKKLVDAVKLVLKALSAADPWLALDDASAISALADSLGGKKKFPPFGRAVVLDWLGDIRGRPPRRRSLASLPAYVKLALADAGDALPALRTAAASALATLTLLGDLANVAGDDKRLATKLDELVDERRQHFVVVAAAKKTAAKKPAPKKPAPTSSASSQTRPAATTEPPRAVASGGQQQQQQRHHHEPSRTTTGGSKPPQRQHNEPAARTVSAAPRKVSVDEPLATTFLRPAGEDHALSGRRAVALKDVVSAATRTALGEASDKESWKRRREALESIVGGCSRVARAPGQYLEATKDVRQLVADLRPRLADAQAKLRPLACDALAAVVAAVEPREAAARLGAKLAARSVLGAVLDTSRGVRTPALSALSICLGEDVDGKIVGKALADVAQHMAAALAGNASPAAKPELLRWITARAKSTGPAQAPDLDRELVPPLLQLMTDKSKETREASHACLAALADVGAVTKLAVHNMLRDVAPAARRSLEPRLQDVCFAEEEEVPPVVIEDALPEEYVVETSVDELPSNKVSIDTLSPPARGVPEDNNVEEGSDETAPQRSFAELDETPPHDEGLVSSTQPTGSAFIEEPASHHEAHPTSTPPAGSEATLVEKAAPVANPSGDAALTEIAAPVANPPCDELPPPKIVVPPAALPDESLVASKEETRPSGNPSRFSETGEELVVTIPSSFHFDADSSSGSRDQSFGDPGDDDQDVASHSPHKAKTTDAMLAEATLDLESATREADLDEERVKKALKVVIYAAQLPSPPAINDGLASTLASVVDVGVSRVLSAGAGGDRSRLARLGLVAALACVKLATMRRAAIRDVLRVATKRAAELVHENDLELRTALNDLAVAASLDASRPEALAAVLDLLAEDATSSPLVAGQLARIVHLATTDRQRDWLKVDGLEPLVHAAHDLLDTIQADKAHRLALDAAKTVVALVTDTIGLDALLALADKTGCIPRHGALCEFATRIADEHRLDRRHHSQRRTASDPQQRGRPNAARGTAARPTHDDARSFSTTATTNSNVLNGGHRATSDLAARLRDVKVATTRGRESSRVAAANSNNAAERIAALRRRLASSAAS